MNLSTLDFLIILAKVVIGTFDDVFVDVVERAPQGSSSLVNLFDQEVDVLGIINLVAFLQ